LLTNSIIIDNFRNQIVLSKNNFISYILQTNAIETTNRWQSQLSTIYGGNWNIFVAKLTNNQSMIDFGLSIPSYQLIINNNERRNAFCIMTTSDHQYYINVAKADD
jgi:hypothetical protein